MKKQTIWLLTMLSLVVVLSVYYVTTPDNLKTTSFMNMNNSTNTDSLDSTPKDTKKTDSKTDTSKQNSDTSKQNDKETASQENSTSEVFLKQRMEQEDERSQLIDEYKATVDSATASAQEKSDAFTNMNELQKLTALESDVETMIKEAGYKDALVRSDKDEVKVDVTSAKPSRKAANDIIQMTRSVLGEKLVVVKFQVK
ncbi:MULTISPECIES: SpoIIIAH-like family protein [unclassified Bacillus (in: firmicutes)]|uniref:SpoIIIAH-like family protein n=1 Tax=unclassified Bacillus (in: firmicutes) TaxID=185979 RepID=UPI000BF43E1D|nr:MULTISPECIES: SpoIIIAH-like family protein [unclassified Bacillus (in: firmicutes)]PFH84784.1 stage III sporulation protein AH [Bacillus sp. AFS088145]PGM52614.1 stage III sporulation protein AH [Bacillus sp. AFS053548]